MNDQQSESSFTKWVHQMWNTQDEEISCSECFDLIPRYVDLELAGGQAEESTLHVKHHLDHCKACRDEYLILLDLARLEAEGKLPPVEDLKDSLR